MVTAIFIPLQGSKLHIRSPGPGLIPWHGELTVDFGISDLFLSYLPPRYYWGTTGEIVICRSSAISATAATQHNTQLGI